MNRANILCLYRERECSFRSVAEDRAILRNVGCLLEGNGAQVTYADATGSPIDAIIREFHLVLNMRQSLQMLQALRRLEHQVMFLNKPSSSLTCQRLSMLRTLARRSISHPHWNVIPISKLPVLSRGQSPYWMKRPDLHAEDELDVVLISNAERRDSVWEHLHHKKIRRVIVQQHVTGKLLKCYSVPAVKWFFCAEVDALDEPIRSDIRQLVTRLGSIFGLAIYGVDIILTSKNESFVIDVNDWPSFKSCIDTASRAIAQLAQDSVSGACRARNT